MELASAHERSAPGRVTVLPIIVDDLARALHVLRALCEVAEGRLFDSRAPDLQSPVPGTTDPVRRAAIATALSTEGSGGTRRIVLIEAGATLVDAEFRSPPTGADPSTGERAVLAVARAVAHRELDDRELAVIAYSESGIDYPFRRCLWSMAVDHLASLPHNTLRTLIFVAEANIDIELHCQAGRGFRFALSGSRLLRRHVRDDLASSARQIAQHVGPTVFFLGAGFGASSRLPLGNTLRDTAIRRLLGIPGSEPLSSEQLGLRFHRWISEREGWLTESELSIREDDFARQLTLEQVIRAEKRVFPNLPTLQEFRTHHDDVIEAPGQAVIDLAYTLEAMAGRAVVVEVNFDQLVERHCPIPLRVFSSINHFEEAAGYIRRYLAGEETAIPVLKLHGSIEEPDTCVVSDEQTQRGLGPGKLSALRALLDTIPRLWIYVGASMRDRDLLPVLRSEDFARGLDERWVSPYLDFSVEEFAWERRGFWANTELKSIDGRLITETADAFFAALRAELP